MNMMLLLLWRWRRRRLMGLMVVLMMLMLMLLLLRRPQYRHQVVELLLQLRGSRGRRPLGHALARRHHLMAVFA
jgi:hypothetical protein